MSVPNRGYEFPRAWLRASAQPLSISRRWHSLFRPPRLGGGLARCGGALAWDVDGGCRTYRTPAVRLVSRPAWSWSTARPQKTPTRIWRPRTPIPAQQPGEETPRRMSVRRRCCRRCASRCCSQLSLAQFGPAAHKSSSSMSRSMNKSSDSLSPAALWSSP